MAWDDTPPSAQELAGQPAASSWDAAPPTPQEIAASRSMAQNAWEELKALPAGLSHLADKASDFGQHAFRAATGMTGGMEDLKDDLLSAGNTAFQALPHPTSTTGKVSDFFSGPWDKGSIVRHFEETGKHPLQSLHDRPIGTLGDAATVVAPFLGGVEGGAVRAAGAAEAAEGTGTLQRLANTTAKPLEGLGNMADKAASKAWFKAGGGTLRDAKELGSDEAIRLGRLMRDKNIVTPMNSAESMSSRVDDALKQSGKTLGDIRAQAEMYGDAPEAQRLIQSIRQDIGRQYGTGGRYEGESGQFEQAMRRLDSLSPVDRLEPSEELQGFMRNAPEEQTLSFNAVKPNPNFTPVPETINRPSLMQTQPPGGQMPLFTNSVPPQQDLLSMDPFQSQLRPGTTPTPNPLFKSGEPTLSSVESRTVNPYEQFRAAQEDPNYIPEYDIRRPTTFQQVADLATEFNQDARTARRLLQPDTAKTDVANQLSRLNDEALMKAVPQEMGQQYQGALQDYSDMSKVQRFTDNKLNYETGASRNFISNNPLNWGLHHFGYQMSGTGADMIASGSFRLANVIKAAPQALGPYADVLSKAAARGDQALAATDYVLQQRDPSYRQMLEGLGAFGEFSNATGQ